MEHSPSKQVIPELSQRILQVALYKSSQELLNVMIKILGEDHHSYLFYSGYKFSFSRKDAHLESENRRGASQYKVNIRKKRAEHDWINIEISDGPEWKLDIAYVYWSHNKGRLVVAEDTLCVANEDRGSERLPTENEVQGVCDAINKFQTILDKWLQKNSPVEAIRAGTKWGLAQLIKY